MMHRNRIQGLLLALFAVSVVRAEISGEVRVNTIGYKPAFAKRATVVGEHGDAAWQVRRVSNDEVVLSGTLSPVLATPDNGEKVQQVDFSALVEPGEFYLQVEGVGRSVGFRVSGDIYNKSFELQLAGLYGLRCGQAVRISHDGEVFSHEACHLNDAKMDYVGGSETVDGTGGWHDAGDYGKYMVNAAFSMGVMLQAWERFPEQLGKVVLPIPEAGGDLPDFLDEMKYELDWMLRNAAVYGDGRIPHKLTRTDFSGMVMPKTDTADRYWVPYGSASTAGFTAVMALAARIYKPYDADYAASLQAAADKSYAWLLANPAEVRPDQTGFSTGAYGSSDADDRLWAASEMWESTGSETALKDFEARAGRSREILVRNWSWSTLGNLGMFTYLNSKREGRDAEWLKKVRDDLIAAADEIVANAASHGYGRGMNLYFWGCNGAVALQGMMLQSAYDLTSEKRYLDCAVDQISFLYGRNPYNRSQVTGEGLNPPLHPHHRPSVADGISNPWPGLLVGGGWPGPTAWQDDAEDYRTNEIAINWTASMVYLLSMFTDYPVSVGPPEVEEGKGSE